MNRVVAVILVVVLSGCAKNFNQVYAEYEIGRNDANLQCAKSNTTFVKYFTCYDNWNRTWALNALKNNEIDAQRHYDFEYNRKLQYQGMMPIARARDAGEITAEEYDLKVIEVNKLIRDALDAQARVRAARDAQARAEANRRSLQALQILSAYGAAVRATTPQPVQQPNHIIPPQDLWCYYNNC